MNTFGLKVIASDKIFFDGRSTAIVVPVSDGEMAVMAHHENMVISIVEGEIRFQKEDGQWEYAVTGRGILQVFNNRVLLIADTIERPEEVDINRALAAKERAEEQLRQKRSLEEYLHSQASLARALSRLRISDKYRKGGL